MRWKLTIFMVFDTSFTNVLDAKIEERFRCHGSRKSTIPRDTNVIKHFICTKSSLSKILFIKQAPVKLQIHVRKTCASKNLLWNVH